MQRGWRSRSAVRLCSCRRRVVLHPGCWLGGKEGGERCASEDTQVGRGGTADGQSGGCRTLFGAWRGWVLEMRLPKPGSGAVAKTAAPGPSDQWRGRAHTSLGGHWVRVERDEARLGRGRGASAAHAITRAGRQASEASKRTDVRAGVVTRLSHRTARHRTAHPAAEAARRRRGVGVDVPPYRGAGTSFAADEKRACRVSEGQTRGRR